jgi:hypothetical protein
MRIVMRIQLSILAFLVALPNFCLAAQSRMPAPDQPKLIPCSVAGTVVQMAGSVPIKSATVRLESVEDHSRTFSGATDAAGRFEIKGIDPGGYRLRVIRNGFVTQEYGQRTPGDAGAVLSLRSGQDMKDLLFRLLPAAVISGRIQNEDGDPLPWVRVSALRETYMRGRRRLSSEVTVVTDDHGEYRLFGLRPGRYFVNATYKPGQRLDTGSDDSEEGETAKSGYVPVYYPGSPDLAKALSIAVKSGEEISSMDMMLEPTTVYTIRGRVNNLVARRSSSGVILILESRPNGQAWSIPNRQALVDKPDGTFEIHGVLPGSYTLMAYWAADDGKRYQMRQQVDVGNLDVDGVQLTLAPGMTVSGQVVWDPKPSMDRDALMVSVMAADSSNSFGSQTRVGPNGAFALKDLSDGLYRLATSGQSPDCYLKSIRYAGMEVSDDEFNVIRGTQATLEVTISSRGARVQGTVTTADGLPAVGVWVVLVPDEKHRSEFHLFKQKITDQYGRFDIRGIAPGDYKIFSWEQVEQSAWEDPDFLKQFEGKGESVSLQESEAKQLDLVAIRTASNEQEK